MRRLLVPGLLFLCSALAQSPRLTSPIVDSDHVVLKRSVHPKAQSRFDQGRAAPGQLIHSMTMALEMSPAQQAELESLLEQQQNRLSTNFHRWLTPEEFGSRFGLHPADLSAISAWLASQGFQVDSLAHARNWIAFSGSVAQVQAAFQTEIHRYLVNGELHFANATELSLPAALDGLVSEIRGINDFDVALSNAQPDYNTAGGTHELAPDDWATIYNVKPLYQMGIDGTGQRIAILGRSDISPSDMDDFRSRFGLPPSTIEQHLIGPDPGVTNAAGEAALDLEWAGAIAPNATLVYVYANNFNTAAQAVVDQGLATVMSESFGTCEPDAPPGLRALAQQANAEGITFVASSGDSGPAGCDPHGTFGSTNGTPASGGFAVMIPASFPEVTAMGGTQFNEGNGQYWSGSNGSTGASALSYIPEVVWNASGAEGLLASGGGASIYFSKPPWQNAPGVPADGVRDTPDISFAASGDHDPYIVLRGGVQRATGGTSAAAPSFAGVLALLNQYVTTMGQQAQPGLGNINPQLYRMARTTTDVFHDITQGDAIVPCVQGTPDCTTGSYGFRAGQGYDLAAGLGSLDVYRFVTEWTAQLAGSQTTVVANPASISPGDPVQVTATVQAPGVATGNVTFNAGPAILGTTPLMNFNGVTMATLTVPAGTLPSGNATVTATYSGDGEFNPSSGSVTVNVAPRPPGSSVTLTITPNPAHGGQTVRVMLAEKNGFPTTVTGWTINGADDSQFLVQDFGTTTIPAFGELATGVTTVAGATFPLTRTYVFTGVDADGRTWSQQMNLVLVAALGTPQMTLSGAPNIVQQNPAADPSCAWQTQLLLQEQSGLAVQLTRLVAGGSDWSSRIPALFGTNRLASLGSLQAAVCQPASTPGQSVTYEVDGIDQTGSPVTATFASTLASAAASRVSLTASPDLLPLSVTASSQTATATLDVAADNASWSIAVFPSNRKTAWLSVNPVSGSGTQPVTLTASSNGLANGVYSASLILQATNTVPQMVEIPVVFTVGPTSSMQIGGLANGASFQPGSFAPGMALSIFGTQLAPSVQCAPGVPLPAALAGVSATVNGVPAPLYYVSASQLNVQIPYETGLGLAVLGVDNNGSVAAASFRVSPAAPGIFTDANQNIVPAGAGHPGDTLSLFLTGDGALSSTLATGASPFNGTPLEFLPQSGFPVTVTVGGVPAQLAFIGIPPGLVGTTQINFVVPQTAPAGVQPVIVTVNGTSSAPANLSILH